MPECDSARAQGIDFLRFLRIAESAGALEYMSNSSLEFITNSVINHGPILGFSQFTLNVCRCDLVCQLDRNNVLRSFHHLYRCTQKNTSYHACTQYVTTDPGCYCSNRCCGDYGSFVQPNRRCSDDSHVRRIEPVTVLAVPWQGQTNIKYPVKAGSNPCIHPCTCIQRFVSLP